MLSCMSFIGMPEIEEIHIFTLALTEKKKGNKIMHISGVP